MCALAVEDERQLWNQARQEEETTDEFALVGKLRGCLW